MPKHYEDADIAEVCHSANRALQLLHGDAAPSEEWDSAPEWQRLAAIDGVKAARAGATPEQLHEAWCDAKYAAGWTEGPTKDDVALTHPCLVPYAELPRHQRDKDVVFAAIVLALAG